MLCTEVICAEHGVRLGSISLFSLQCSTTNANDEHCPNAVFIGIYTAAPVYISAELCFNLPFFTQTTPAIVKRKKCIQRKHILVVLKHGQVLGHSCSVSLVWVDKPSTKCHVAKNQKLKRYLQYTQQDAVLSRRPRYRQ